MSNWIEGMARFGYAAKGVVYLIVGGLVIAAARRGRAQGADHYTAFAFILQQPFGRTMLVIVAIGLAGYALYRLIAGISDSEQRGSDVKGLVLRGASIGRGLLYSGLALVVIRLVRHRSSGAGSDEHARHWTSWLLDAPLGRFLAVALGLGIVGYGVYQLYAAFAGKLTKQLRLGELQASVRKRVEAISRFGIGARGVVFFVMGGSLALAGYRHSPAEARGTAGALRELATKPFGGTMLLVVGIGLCAYGVYALVNARYRRIDP
jgi:hypothetical protein